MACLAVFKLVVLGAMVVDFGQLAQWSGDCTNRLAVVAGLAEKPAPVAVAKAPAAKSEQVVAQAPEPESGVLTQAHAQEGAAGGANGGGGLEREALLRKQEELNRQEGALKTLEQDIDAKLVKLQELQAKLDRMLKEADDMRDKKLKHLVDVYSNMKAKQAAAVLETLDEKIAVKILAGMRGRQAGEILTNVNAEKAAKLSEALTRMQVPFE